ncbi:hypothetical protein ACP70R_038775 [Stipagrostis hirtigluma subsp. patula]
MVVCSSKGAPQGDPKNHLPRGVVRNRACYGMLAPVSAKPSPSPPSVTAPSPSRRTSTYPPAPLPTPTSASTIPSVPPLPVLLAGSDLPVAQSSLLLVEFAPVLSVCRR